MMTKDFQTSSAEVEADFCQYMGEISKTLFEASSNDRDLKSFGLDYWHFPLLYVTTRGEGNTSVLILDRDEYLDSIQRNLGDVHLRSGWSGGYVIEKTKVAMLGAELAVIDVVGSRMANDGSVLNEFCAWYIMRKSEGRWRQASIFNAAKPLPALSEWLKWLTTIIGQDKVSAFIEVNETRIFSQQ